MGLAQLKQSLSSSKKQNNKLEHLHQVVMLKYNGRSNEIMKCQSSTVNVINIEMNTKKIQIKCTIPTPFYHNVGNLAKKEVCMSQAVQ